MDMLTSWMPEDWSPTVRMVVVVVLLLVILCCCLTICAALYIYAFGGSGFGTGPGIGLFGEGDNEGFVAESAPIVEPAVVSETPDDIPSNTPEPELSPTPTATSEPDWLIDEGDPAGDVVVLGTTTQVGDPYADVVGVRVTLAGPESDRPDSYLVDILMGASPEDALRLAFSYAIALQYVAETGEGRILYQVHDGVQTIGVVDPNNQVIFGGEDAIGPDHQVNAVQAWLPADTTEFYIETFHLQQEQGSTAPPTGVEPVDQPNQVHGDRFPDEGSMVIPTGE